MASAIVGTLRAILTLDAAEFRTESAKVSASAKAFSKDFKAIGQQATSLGSTLTRTLTLPLAGLAVGAGKAAIDFESSFAGVRKTVNATEPEFAAMAQQFRNLAKEIPINVNELNRLGEAAGALGIPKAEIVDFSRVMGLLGVTTNLTADQAAESIAKIQNIFGAAGKETENFASTLVALGNDGASTESQIVEMASRIAGAGNAVGMTQGQVLAFASALSSVGIEAEMGGSAISRVFIDIASAVSEGGDAVDGFAQVAGMSIPAFSKMFKDDAAGAVDAFVRGLGGIKQTGGDLLGTLEELGFKEIRVRDTLLRAAGAGDLLTRALDLQQTAWRENTALTAEADKRFATVASQMALLWNRVKDVGIELGMALLPVITKLVDWAGKLVPVIEGAVRWFASLPEPVQMAAIGLVGVTAAIGPLIYAFGQVALSLSAVTAAFTANGIAMRAMTGISAGLGTALAFVGKSIAVVGVAFAGWNIGKWIGEVTGLTNGVEWLTGRMMGLTTEQIMAGRAAREQAEAIMAQQEATADTAETTKLFGQIQAEVTKATTQANTAVANIVGTTKEKTKADKESEKAAKALTKSIEDERDAVRELGLVTERDVNDHLAQFQSLLNRATAEGVPMASALKAILPKLEDLAAKARASGLNLGDLTDIIRDVKAEIQSLGGAIPTMSHLITTIDLASLSTQTITAETMKAGTNAYLTQRAFEAFGLSTQAQLDAVAATARARYAELVASGQATAEQLKIAAAEVAEAELAAGQRTRSIWVDEVWPAIQGAFAQFKNDVTTHLVDMLTGAESFKEGWKGIWESLKGFTRSVLQTMLQTFLNEFLGGMMQGLGGWAKSAGQIIGSIFGGGGGGFGGLGGIMSGGMGVGSGVPSIGAYGASAGYGGGAGVGSALGAAGLGVAAAGAAYTLGKVGYEWISSAFGEHYISPGANYERQVDEARQAADYLGMSFEDYMASGMGGWMDQPQGFADGTHGMYANFGAGTMAMLHNDEAVVPKAYAPTLAEDIAGALRGFGSGAPREMRIVIERDGRSEAEWLVPFLPGAQERLQFA